MKYKGNYRRKKFSIYCQNLLSVKHQGKKGNWSFIGWRCKIASRVSLQSDMISQGVLRDL